ncbi:MAG: glucose-6-phosphate isomerase, partial [Paracoccaceae bacterium]
MMGVPAPMWDRLRAMAAQAQRGRIVDLFADPNRAGDFSARMGGLLFDYSKTSLNRDARAALFALCDAAGLAARRDAMFAGDAVNETESRAVLHTALRDPGGAAL